MATPNGQAAQPTRKRKSVTQSDSLIFFDMTCEPKPPIDSSDLQVYSPPTIEEGSCVVLISSLKAYFTAPDIEIPASCKLTHQECCPEKKTFRRI